MYQTHKILFWWETVELPPAKEKITNQTQKKPHKDKVSAEEKSPTFGFPTAKPSSRHYKKTQAPPGGGKLFFPRKQALPQAVLPCPIFFTWIKWKLELGLIKRWILGIRWAGMSSPSTAQPSCHGRCPCQASPSQGWLFQWGFQRDGNRFSSYPWFIPVHLPVPFQGSLVV